MADVKETKKPADNAFQQQRLKAWQPLLTPKWVIGTFYIVAVLFITIGVVILSVSNSVVEKEIRYDNMAEGNVQASISIDEDMDAPIYVYYKLTNFYQNHRRYVKSRSDGQLRGEELTTESELDSCAPLITSTDDNDVTKLIYPCVLIANSFFNDNFTASIDRDGTVTSLNGENWNKNNIAWDSDYDKFKDPEYDVTNDDFTRINTRGYVMPDVTDPDFMVWMRTAGLPTFKKLYRVIDNFDLKAGDTMNVDINNIYPVSDFKGEKYLVISTASWLGGKNSFLGYAYIVVGAVCLVLGLAFNLKHYLSPRDLGNMKYFNFPQIGGEDAENNSVDE